MTELVLEKCQILHNGALAEVYIGIKNGFIEKISKQKLTADKTIDCTGKTAFPGLIDSHVHFRTPGETEKEDWIHAGKSALAGGVTTALDMPNNNPPTTTVSALIEKRKLVEKSSLIDYGFHFGAVHENNGELKQAVKIASIKMYTALSTGNLLLENKDKIEKVFRTGHERGLVVCVHAENNEIIEKNKKKFSKSSDPLIHSKVRNNESESLAIEHLLEIQNKIKNKLYFCHVSSKESLKLIEEAKEEGVNVFCEVTPHHLFFNDKSLEKLRNFGKVNPSIKSEKDRLALWRGIKSGVVDVVASDHAPHLISEKKQPYWSAPSGMPGVQTMLLVLLDAVKKKKISLEDIHRLCCENPAKIFGIESKGSIRDGFLADFAIVDLNKKTRFSNKMVYSKCGWSAFNGVTFEGRIEKTILGGKLAFDNGKFFKEVLGKEVF